MIGRLLCAVGLHWREPKETTIAAFSHVRVAIEVPLCVRCGSMSNKDARHLASLYQLAADCASDPPLKIVPLPPIRLAEKCRNPHCSQPWVPCPECVYKQKGLIP